MISNLRQDKLKTRNEFMQCPICGKQGNYFTQGSFTSDGIKTIIPIYYCKSCNSFIKKIDDDSILSYFKSSVYTDLNCEQEAYNHRMGLFKYIYSKTKVWNSKIINWLDYGCSYGHFVDFLNGENISSYGIEISDDVRHYGNSKGLKIYKKFEELPQNKTFDVISFIDTFYYSLYPGFLLTMAFSLLSENGLLVIRDTNRNWLVKYDKYIRRKETCTALIDHVIGYSKKSMSYLLRNNGFEILETTFKEKGKYRSKMDNFLFSVATVFYKLSFGFINFMPGLIIIARKNPNYLTN